MGSWNRANARAPYDFDFSIRRSADGRIHCDGWHVPTMGTSIGAPLSAYTRVHVTDTARARVLSVYVCARTQYMRAHATFTKYDRVHVVHPRVGGTYISIESRTPH